MRQKKKSLNLLQRLYTLHNKTDNIITFRREKKNFTHKATTMAAHVPPSVDVGGGADSHVIEVDSTTGGGSSDFDTIDLNPASGGVPPPGGRSGIPPLGGGGGIPPLVGGGGGGGGVPPPGSGVPPPGGGGGGLIGGTDWCGICRRLLPFGPDERPPRIPRVPIWVRFRDFIRNRFAFMRDPFVIWVCAAVLTFFIFAVVCGGAIILIVLHINHVI